MWNVCQVNHAFPRLVYTNNHIQCINFLTEYLLHNFHNGHSLESNNRLTISIKILSMNNRNESGILLQFFFKKMDISKIVLDV